MKVDRETRRRMLIEVEQVSSRHEEIMLSYVYGTFVREAEFRDLDIAMVLATPMPPYQEGKFCGTVGRELEGRVKPRIEIDVRAINSAPPQFQYEVIRNGQLVFARSEDGRIGFEEEVLSNYLDYEDTLKWFERKLIAEQ